jgi:hypothetical protein
VLDRGYSTNRGTSLERHSFTVFEMDAALQKLTRYLREKVRETGSVSSISTFNSGLSTLVWLRRVIAPFPISPEEKNLTPSFEVSIVTTVLSA